MPWYYLSKFAVGLEFNFRKFVKASGGQNSNLKAVVPKCSDVVVGDLAFAIPRRSGITVLC